ncbi:MAG: XRE family transcriptional regulator, partial [Calditrichaeota bacterium]
IGLNEHYCRRWLSISVLREMAADGGSTDPTETRVAAQRSRFVETGAEFFTITVARPLALSQGGHSSISLGFLMNDAFKRVVRFWNDDRVPVIEVNETCERCGLSTAQCSERVAPPEIFTQEQNQRVREEALRRFMLEHLSSNDSE